jgi:hypothetical protein
MSSNSDAAHGVENGAAKAELHLSSPSRQRPRARADHGKLSQSAEEQMRILMAIRANLEVHHETLEDPDLMLLLAEGETSLLETLDFMLEADLFDEGLLHGLKAQKDTLAVRLHRIEERRQSRRAILEQALLLMQRKSLERPIATLSLSDRPPTLIVEEEAQIPSRFFDLKPMLNRRLTKEALTSGEEVPGARLSNGSISLTVRRR